jgi:hypothetical protein
VEISRLSLCLDLDLPATIEETGDDHHRCRRPRLSDDFGIDSTAS